MDEGKQKVDGEHILLRYATQFTSGGRTRTVEMSIPVPFGASEEQREQLLREADAGMLQLATHVEKLASQVIQRTQGNGASQPGERSQTQASRPAQPPSPRPAATAAPQTAEQPGARTREQGGEPARPEMLRQGVGASMPASAGVDPGSNLLLPQFIKIINETMGLNPTQAMQKLQVKSLSGVNLRKALETLQQMQAQENSNGRAPLQEMREQSESPTRTATHTGSLRMVHEEANSEEPARDEGRANLRSVGFDEEESVPEDLTHDELDDLDFSGELTVQQRMQAQSVISRLRDARGTTPASRDRLQVLSNVVGDQLSREQLLNLVAGIWDGMTLLKLKKDQLEALISWAKEDDFVSEAEAILVLLEEGV